MVSILCCLHVVEADSYKTGISVAHQSSSCLVGIHGGMFRALVELNSKVLFFVYSSWNQNRFLEQTGKCPEWSTQKDFRCRLYGVNHSWVEQAGASGKFRPTSLVEFVNGFCVINMDSVPRLVTSQYQYRLCTLQQAPQRHPHSTSSQT